MKCALPSGVEISRSGIVVKRLVSAKVFILWLLANLALGGVPELADGRGLGPRAGRRGGSSPPFPTIMYNRGNPITPHDWLLTSYRKRIPNCHFLTCNLNFSNEALNKRFILCDRACPGWLRSSRIPILLSCSCLSIFRLPCYHYNIFRLIHQDKSYNKCRIFTMPRIWSISCRSGSQRVGKQRVEAYQIIRAMSFGGGWSNHPVVRMWSVFENALKMYSNAMVEEWIRRGYRNNLEILPRWV